MKENNSEKNWQQLGAALADGVIIVNTEGIILYANEPAASLFGKLPTSLIGENFLYPISANEIQEIEIFKSNSKIHTAEMNVKLGAWNNNPAWIISLRDITQIKQKIEQLEIASRVFNHAHEAIIVTDADMVIVDINQSVSRILGYKRKDVIGKNVSTLKSTHNSQELYQELWSSIKETGGWQGEVWQKHKNGKQIPIFVTISVVKNQDNEITNYIGFCHDLILQKKQQAKISHMKYYDSLTNLPNQYFLSENLDSLMRVTHKLDEKIVVIYISIDGLNSEENGSLITSMDKNATIISASKKICNTLQGYTFLTHISYSAFVAVFDKINNVMNLIPQVQELIQELLLPHYFTNNSIKLTTNIGITSYPGEQICFAEELIRQAYLAAYEAKIAGENQYKFFDNALERQKLEYNQQIHDIRKAIATNKLLIYYQPKVNMRTGEIIGAEALLRLQYSDNVVLVPEDFLPNIESNPISAEIGEWVLDEVLKQIEKWQSFNYVIPVSINITPFHLQQVNFVSNLKTILSRHPNVRSNLIELEILETELLENIDAVKKIINECKKIGILFALDDFGTGYSTLASLKELPASRVKLDQTFVRDIMNKPENITILKACLNMCKSLRRDVIAEGVETALHGKLLLYLGCDVGQGYAIAKAMPAENFYHWLNEWQLLSEWNITDSEIKEGRALINAAMGHFSILESIKHSLIKEAVFVPTTSNFCPLGKWLKTQKNQKKDIEGLDLIHKEIHFKAKQIIKLHYLGNKEAAFRRMEKLEIISSQLFNQLLISKML